MFEVAEILVEEAGVDVIDALSHLQNIEAIMLDHSGEDDNPLEEEVEK